MDGMDPKMMGEMMGNPMIQALSNTVSFFPRFFFCVCISIYTHVDIYLYIHTYACVCIRTYDVCVYIYVHAHTNAGPLHILGPCQHCTFFSPLIFCLYMSRYIYI